MKSVLALALATLSSTAYAEVFSCEGTGKFKGVPTESFELNWNSKDNHKPVFEKDSLRVEVYVDKADADGPHYLGISVIEKQGLIQFKHGAKGSIREMVMYTDDPSLIACVIN